MGISRIPLSYSMAITPKSTLRTVIVILLCYGLISLVALVYQSSSFSARYQEPPPRDNLLFVKTHKTGSTTVINLFQRYAYTHQLLVALPKQDDIFLGWPRLISDQEISKVVLELKNGSYKYNYAINHLVYEKKTTPLLFNSLPDDPIVKVTLLREPAEQLRSSFNYYNILREENDKGSNVVEAMKLFASDPVRFDNSYFMDNWFVKSRTRNPQLADLGLTYQLMDNRDQVQYHAETILENFDLIMVTELMDESCVLLKRLMRWRLEDILYTTKYSLTYAGKTEAIPNDVQQSLHDWSWGDNFLYFKAREKLFHLMNAEPKFHEELEVFKKLNALVSAHCETEMIEGITEASFNKLQVEKSDWNEEFTVTMQFCANMLRNERPFTRLLKLKQRPDIYSQSYYEELEDKRYFADSLTIINNIESFAKKP